jgi:hypothetical protein
MFSPIGRFVRPDGTDLPSLKAIGIGGLAKFLRDELQAFATHYSQTASLQYDGHDLLSHGVYDIPSTPRCPPARFQSAPPTFSSIRTPSESIQDTVQRFVQVGLPSVKLFFYQEKPKKPRNVHRTQSESRSNVFFGVSTMKSSDTLTVCRPLPSFQDHQSEDSEHMTPTASDVAQLRKSTMGPSHEHKNNVLQITTSCPSEAENIHTAYSLTTKPQENSLHVSRVTCKRIVNHAVTLEPPFCLSLDPMHANDGILRSILRHGDSVRSFATYGHDYTYLVFKPFNVRELAQRSTSSTTQTVVSPQD